MKASKFLIHQTVLILALFFLLGNNAHSQVDTSEYKVGDTWIYSDFKDDVCGDKKPVYKYQIIDYEKIGNKLYSRIAFIKSNGSPDKESIIPILKKMIKYIFITKGKIISCMILL
jgi:hypothetical protein